MEKVNPAAVTLARESRQMTQQTLASALGISQGKLSKLENGRGEVEEDLVLRLSNVLMYPPSFFRQELAIQDLPAVFYRKGSKVPALEERSIRARVNILRVGIGRLLKSVDVPPVKVPQVDLSTAETTAVLFARQLRTFWGLPRGPIKNLTDVLERAGVIVVRCDFGEAKVDGLSMFVPSEGLPPIIFVNERRPGDRARFTLAHELGHIIFHYTQPIPSEHAEDEANAFAAEFLAPASDVRPHLLNPTFDNLLSLKRHWGASMMFFLKRGVTLGRIPEWKAKKMYIEAGRLGYRTKEPFPIEQEEPTVFEKLVRVHAEQLGYKVDELWDLVYERQALRCLEPRKGNLRLVS